MKYFNFTEQLTNFAWEFAHTFPVATCVYGKLGIQKKATVEVAFKIM